MSTTGTALITGASSGLGEHFAHLFARDGHDVILVARNEARLEALAERLRVHRIKPTVIAADLSRPGAAQTVFDKVQSRGLTVEFLVNNAGFGSTGPFLDLPRSQEVEMVELNVTALLELCHLFGGPMRARGTGRIMNVASTAGFQPGPFMATYYATKAFVLSFSEALAHELKSSGVTVTCFCPGATATEFAGRAGNDKTHLFKRANVAKADEVAARGYEAMMEGEVLTVPGLMNWVAMEAVRLAPRQALRSVVALLNTKAEP